LGEESEGGKPAATGLGLRPEEEDADAFSDDANRPSSSSFSDMSASQLASLLSEGGTGALPAFAASKLGDTTAANKSLFDALAFRGDSCLGACLALESPAVDAPVSMNENISWPECKLPWLRVLPPEEDIVLTTP